MKANFEEKKDMILAELFSKYSTEIKARKAFKAFCDEQGVICKKCKNTTHYWKQDKWQYECKACRFRTTLRSGTVMESSNLPFRYWMIAIGLMSATKKSFSAMEVQRQLDHKRYEPIWSMLHKIRAAMGRRDDRYQLDGPIEMDEGYFVSQKEKEASNKPPMYSAHGNKGRCNVKVLVSVESKLTIQSNKNKPNRKVSFIKMKVIEKVTKDAVNYEVEKSIAKTANVITDGKKCYNDLKKNVIKHKVKICKDKKEVSKIFPWVHIAISNAKKMCLGIHHSINGIFMQNYLDEFCYKFNRRYFGDKLFNRLMVACIENN